MESGEPDLTRPFPPGCYECDYVGASEEALVAMLESDAVRAADFLGVLIGHVKGHGATHNQRRMLADVAWKCVSAPGPAAPGRPGEDRSGPARPAGV